MMMIIFLTIKICTDSECHKIDVFEMFYQKNRWMRNTPKLPAKIIIFLFLA